MNITSAKFVKSINGTDDILYDGKFQVAFIGRSNVGKSTLINSLVGQKSLARSSKDPGKTIHLDFFLINDFLYFVDLPGYGFANLSGERQDKFRKMMLWYLLYSEVKNRLVVLIIDSKVGLTNFDREMMGILKEGKINFIIVANKIDKLKMGEKERQLKQIQEECGDVNIIPFSSKTKRGRFDILGKLFSFI